MKPTEHKLKIITVALQLLEHENLAKKSELANLIVEHGKMYHVTIKPLKSAKKPLIRSLILFAAGSDISINEPAADMQTLLSELNHSIK